MTAGNAAPRFTVPSSTSCARGPKAIRTKVDALFGPVDDPGRDVARDRRAGHQTRRPRGPRPRRGPRRTGPQPRGSARPPRSKAPAASDASAPLRARATSRGESWCAARAAGSSSTRTSRERPPTISVRERSGTGSSRAAISSRDAPQDGVVGGGRPEGEGHDRVRRRSRRASRPTRSRPAARRRGSRRCGSAAARGPARGPRPRRSARSRSRGRGATSSTRARRRRPARGASPEASRRASPPPRHWRRGTETNTSAMGTTICGSSSRGVARTATRPAAIEMTMRSGESGPVTDARTSFWTRPSFSSAITRSPRGRRSHRGPGRRGPRRVPSARATPVVTMRRSQRSPTFTRTVASWPVRG